VNDTIAWWEEADRRYRGKAADFARVFPVPGMGHCQGGPATDRFDAFSALVDWVEHRRAPASLPAKAGPASPWPDRARPLCPYPQVARPAGAGAAGDGAAAFACVG
jgi:feruloyl esterase